MLQALPKGRFSDQTRGHTTLTIKHENQSQTSTTMLEFKPYTLRSTNQAHTTTRAKMEDGLMSLQPN